MHWHRFVNCEKNSKTDELVNCDYEKTSSSSTCTIKYQYKHCGVHVPGYVYIVRQSVAVPVVSRLLADDSLSLVKRETSSNSIIKPPCRTCCGVN